MDNRQPEPDDRAARGPRIFDALRRGREEPTPEPAGEGGTATAVEDGPARPEDPSESPAPSDSATTAAPAPVEEQAEDPAPEQGEAQGDEEQEEEDVTSGPAYDPTPGLPGAEILDAQLQAPPPPVNPPPPVVVAPPPLAAPPRPTVTAAPTPSTDAPAGQAPEPTAAEPAAPEGQVDVEASAHPAAAAETAVEEVWTEELLGLPRVVAIANQKGGVGKTTTAVNLSAALTELDYRVLVVDLDPQGNATTGVGVDIRNLDNSLYEALMTDTPLEDCIEPTSVRNLFVAPSNMDLAGAEIELVPVFSRELKLRRAIEAVKDDYDFVLIDCPPSLGLLTVNGLAAADDVIVPIQCEYYALEGLGQLVNNVNLVRSNLNPVLDIRGIVLTMYDARTKLADQVVAEVRKHFGTKVFRTVVPRTVRLSEAPSFGQPIIVFDSHSRGSDAYRNLAKEWAGRVEGGAERVAAMSGGPQTFK